MQMHTINFEPNDPTVLLATINACNPGLNADSAHLAIASAFQYLIHNHEVETIPKQADPDILILFMITKLTPQDIEHYDNATEDPYDLIDIYNRIKLSLLPS